MKRKLVLYVVMFLSVVTCMTAISVTQLKAKPKAYLRCGPINCNQGLDCYGPCPYCVGTCVAVY
jgi:hypothetical protein